MSEPHFEDVIDVYRKEACTRLMEDFVDAFVLCGFQYYELLFAVADCLTKRNLDRAAYYLEQAAQVVPGQSSYENLED